MTALCSIVAMVGIGLLAFHFVDPTIPKASDIGYFTTDEGATYFKASFGSPPYMKDGKPATRVMLFTGDGGNTCFVGYLIRTLPSSDRVPVAEVCRPGPGQPWVLQPPPGTPPNDPKMTAYHAITAIRVPGTNRLAARIEP